MPPSTRAGQTGREERDDDQAAATAGNGREEGWLTQVVRILQLVNPALTAEEAIVRAMSLVNIGNQAPRGEAEKIPKDVTSSIAHIKKLNEGNWHTWEPTFIDCLQRVHNAKEILYGEIAPGSEGCHGPECSGSRRVTGSYGRSRSIGIEELVDTSRKHGRSAVSMETMDSYGFTCKGGLGPYARRASHEEDQAQGAGTATEGTKLKEHADGYHSGARETRAKGTITGQREGAVYRRPASRS
ncbi:uncharacterized protein UDID_17852 [Ustilago sp. UG-2017a]|nr:uncharacterized protein UDID_17852 [Ustilago sp. UG-2017a]